MLGELEILKFGAKVLGVAAGGNLNGGRVTVPLPGKRDPDLKFAPPPLMAATRLRCTVLSALSRLHHQICMETFISLSTLWPYQKIQTGAKSKMGRLMVTRRGSGIGASPAFQPQT